jgi:outer membrane protein assembly factor BamB
MTCSSWSAFHGDGQHTGRSSAPAITSCHLRWKFTAEQMLSSPVISLDGSTIYFGCNGAPHPSVVYALDAGAGYLKWKFIATSQIEIGSAVIGSNGILYISSISELFALNGSTGTLIWKYPMGGQTSPVIGTDGTVYLASLNEVYSFNGTTGKVNWVFDTTATFVFASPTITNDGYSDIIYVAPDEYYEQYNMSNVLYALYPMEPSNGNRSLMAIEC